MMTTEEMVMYDMMVELGVATSEELNLARDLVSGSWKEILTQVLDIRTGYKSMMTTEEMVMYDMMIELGVATSEELNLARNLVSGSWKEVLTQVLDIRTGYKSIEQMLEEEE